MGFYRLKKGAGTHRLKSEKPGELGRKVEPDEVIELSAEQVKAFGHKFDPAPAPTKKSTGASPTATA